MRLVDDDAFDDDGMHRWRRRVEDGRSHASVVGGCVGVVDGSGTVATLGVDGGARRVARRRRRWWRRRRARPRATNGSRDGGEEPPPRGYAPPPRGARWSKPSRRTRGGAIRETERRRRRRGKYRVEKRRLLLPTRYPESRVTSHTVGFLLICSDATRRDGPPRGRALPPNPPSGNPPSGTPSPPSFSFLLTPPSRPYLRGPWSRTSRPRC